MEVVLWVRWFSNWIGKRTQSICSQMFDSTIVGTPLLLLPRRVVKLLLCNPKGCKLQRLVYDTEKLLHEV